MSINRCGATANTSGPGLAVPISIPRYTKAESTLTISQGSRRTNSTAKPVLPEAVGPMRKLAVGRDVMARDRPYHESQSAQISGVWLRYWRRGRDSNPRTLAGQRFSRPPLSTAQPPLHIYPFNFLQLT